MTNAQLDKVQWCLIVAGLLLTPQAFEVYANIRRVAWGLRKSVGIPR